MAINVSQSFHRTSSNAIDDTIALTKAQMLTVNDNLMPSKYFTVCQDDGYIYLYDKSNESDPATGKFRKFEGGSKITVDDEMSSSSTNPVQNKVITSALDDKVDTSSVGVASGVAELDANGKVPSSQLPSYVDDVIEGYYKEADGKFYEEDTYETEITGESGKIYLSLDTGIPYRWSGSVFVVIPWGLALGETSSTAYRGDRGKAAYDHSLLTSGNPHNVTASDVGLGNVDNTSDMDKPISTATQDALDEKQDTIQFSLMPAASADLVGRIVEYVGSTTSTYTHGYFYECVNDGGTYSWEQTNVQPSGEYALNDLEDVNIDTPTDGQVLAYDATNDEWINVDNEGGGDAELETAVTSNLTVGAIASGTTLPQGTTFTEFAQKLLITEIAPTIEFSITKSGNVRYGTVFRELLTLNVSAMGTAKKIKKIEWYENSTLKQTDTIDSTTTGSWTYAMEEYTTDTTTFKAVVTYTKSNNVDTSVTKTASVNFYYNKFYGAVGSLTPDEATVEALSTALGTGKGGTYSFTTSASRICYAYPKSLGALTSIKDGNGFSLFDSFTRTEQTYTQNNTSVVYYRYVLTDPTTVSGYNVIFA